MRCSSSYGRGTLPMLIEGDSSVSDGISEDNEEITDSLDAEDSIEDEDLTETDDSEAETGDAGSLDQDDSIDADDSTDAGKAGEGTQEDSLDADDSIEDEGNTESDTETPEDAEDTESDTENPEDVENAEADGETTDSPDVKDYSDKIKESFSGDAREAQAEFNDFMRNNVWNDDSLSNQEKVDIMKSNFDNMIR